MKHTRLPAENRSQVIFKIPCHFPAWLNGILEKLHGAKPTRYILRRLVLAQVRVDLFLPGPAEV